MNVREVRWEILAALRFFLAWVVLCGHSEWFLPQGSPLAYFAQFGGTTAVLGFMLVSGFSIASSLVRKPEGFYVRRFLRIYPVYLSAIIFAQIVAAQLGPRTVLPGHTFVATGPLTTAGNVLLLQMFLCKAIAYDPVVWSLSIECFYYLLAPYFMRTTFWKLAVLMGISAVAYALPPHEAFGPVYAMILKFHPLRYLWSWLLGLLFYRSGKTILYIAGLAGGLVLVRLSVRDNSQLLCPLTYAGSVLIIAFSNRLVLPRIGVRIADWLGEISYPLYVFHVPAQTVAFVVFGLRGYLSLAGVGLLASTAAYYAIDVFLKPRFITPWVLAMRRPAPALQAP